MDNFFVTMTDHQLPQIVTSTREDHLVAWLTALAISVHIAEAALPTPLPGVKPGLANVVTLCTMLMFGWRVALWVGLLRVFVGSLVIGTFLSPAFILSFSGALCSIGALGAVKLLAAKLPVFTVSAIGYGIVAAMAHMAGQFYAAYSLFIPHQGMFHLLPVLMTASLLFGIVSGMIAGTILNRIQLSNTDFTLLHKQGG